MIEGNGNRYGNNYYKTDENTLSKDFDDVGKEDFIEFDYYVGSMWSGATRKINLKIRVLIQILNQIGQVLILDTKYVQMVTVKLS